MLSIPHLIIIFLVALVVLGPEKLPEVARTLGKVMSEFRKVSTDFRSALENEMNEIERQTREKERLAREAAAKALPVAPAAPMTEAAPAQPTAAVEAASESSGEVPPVAEAMANSPIDRAPAAAAEPAPNGESHPA